MDAECKYREYKGVRCWEERKQSLKNGTFFMGC